MVEDLSPPAPPIHTRTHALALHAVMEGLGPEDLYAGSYDKDFGQGYRGMRWDKQG
jgi:hypothetical protein